MLGNMFYKGLGSEQDYEQAKYWYTLAAEQEYPLAQYALGRMFYYGEGVTQNDEKAKELFD
jgi:TPR repeat protein